MTAPDASLSTGSALQRAPIGRHLDVDFDAVAWAPDAADVDLSVACMFEHEAGGAALGGGLAHLDVALGGYLSRVRAEGRFLARELDTLLVSRPPAGVRARAVLVIGLGDPDALRGWSFDVGPAHFAAAAREFEMAFGALSAVDARALDG